MMNDELNAQLDLAKYAGAAPPGELARTQPSERSDLSVLLAAAVGSEGKPGLPADTIKTLVELCHVEADRRARQEFNEAFARFRAACPPVIRATTNANPKMSRVNRKGVKVLTQYASLEDIAGVVDVPLLTEGLTYGWTEATITPNGMLTRSLILRHVGGYSPAPAASPPIPVEGTESWQASAGNRGDTSASPAQRYMIADTTAKRASLIAGLGLPMYYDDADAVITATSEQPITEAQARSLNDLFIAVGEELRAPFLKFFSARLNRPITKLAELPASELELAMLKLESKRK